MRLLGYDKAKGHLPMISWESGFTWMMYVSMLYFSVLHLSFPVLCKKKRWKKYIFRTKRKQKNDNQIKTVCSH